MTLICKSVGIGDGTFNPTYRWGVEITPYINPLYVGFSEGFQKCIICWCRTCVELFRLDFELWVVVGGVASVRT